MTRPRDSGSRLASFVQSRRKDLGLNQSEVYTRAGMSRSAWHHIETGQTKKPQDKTINRIAKALEVDPDQVRSVLGLPRRGIEPWDSGPRWDEGARWDSGSRWIAAAKPVVDGVEADRARVWELAATMSGDQIHRLRELAETVLAS
jgi:transcriptional regulator with XRE-family HTH domain